MEGSWETPACAPSLLVDAVQVWRIELSDDGTTPGARMLMQSLASVLRPEEREQATRMRVGGPAEEFVVGRGCLRRLLGSVLRCDPTSLVMQKGLHGKPFVRAEPGRSVPSFNVAHSRGVILIGMSTVGEVGVDVEFVDRTIDLAGVARTAFHAAEVARVESAPTLEERFQVFYRCWTRKEALAKADGRGLLLEPSTYVAGLDQSETQRVMLPGAEAGDEYFVRELEVGPSHRAAVAIRGGDWPVRMYEFPCNFDLVFGSNQ